jgi:alpha-galactosidase
MPKNTTFILTLLLALLIFCNVKADENILGATPPMGWNSWNHFKRKTDDAIVRAQAEAMVSSGMRDAGYVYINIDDAWEGTRDSSGEIRANSKFPDMKALADFVHSKGLKLGLYSSPGMKTCAGFEGSYGHEEQDAKTYAKWGIDYLKYDLCGLRVQMKAAGSDVVAEKMMKDAYVKMRDALLNSGRPIFYSLCQYGHNQVWQWGASVGGNAWRTTGDINDNFKSMVLIGFHQAGLSKYAGPGHWNDPDMLEIGNGGMTTSEYQIHMSLWAILAAPLLAGNDLSTMTQATKDILLNKEVIAIDQDKLGKQGDRVYAEGSVEIWSRDLADGSKAVGIFNLADTKSHISLDFQKLGLHSPVSARDLWLHKDLGNLNSGYTEELAPHSVVLIKLSQ